MKPGASINSGKPAEITNLFLTDTILMSPGVENSFYKVYAPKDKRFTFVLPQEGFFAIPYTVEIVKGRKGGDLVYDFMNMQLDQEVQQGFMESILMTPVNTRVRSRRAWRRWSPRHGRPPVRLAGHRAEPRGVAGALQQGDRAVGRGSSVLPTSSGARRAVTGGLLALARRVRTRSILRRAAPLSCSLQLLRVRSGDPLSTGFTLGNYGGFSRIATISASLARRSASGSR